MNNQAFEAVASPNNKRRRDGDRAIQSINIGCLTAGVILEEKSIADLVAAQPQVTDNPYEVVRKPPKKKKKSEMADSCFDNPGLNLKSTDTQINPFEIKRTVPDAAVNPEVHCFTNSGLNLKAPERKENYNPFEIDRPSTGESAATSACDAPQQTGIENPALNYQDIAIAVPFTPSVGRRINFHDLQLRSKNNLTPSELLTKTLVFTPVTQEPAGTTPKRANNRRSLPAINEEMANINEELDCYQLELENSMNEAKTKRNLNNGFFEARRSIRLPRRVVVAQTLETLALQKTPVIEVSAIADKTVGDVEFEEVYESGTDDDEEFAQPAPFKRNYRPKEVPLVTVELPAPPSQAKSTLKSVFRQSIRRLVNSHSNKNANDMVHDKAASLGIISSIRQSFRRKAKPTVDKENVELQNIHDQTIMNDTIRPVYRAETADSESDALKRTTTLRQSLRLTTKDVQRQMMKTVFKKKSRDYNCVGLL